VSIVDLQNRLTTNYDDFYKLNKSSDSLVYVKGTILIDDGPATLDLSVGDSWFDCTNNTYYEIPLGGFSLKSGTSAVIETEQTIGMPANVFGLVTGKGTYIFKGIQISSCKIDPGFCSTLRIGLYNAGQQTVSFQRGDAFCSCCFFELESHVDAPSRRDTLVPKNPPTRFPTRQKIATYLKKEWRWLLTLALSILAFIVAIWGFFRKC